MCEYCRNDGKEHTIFESDENHWYTNFLSNGKFYIFHRRRGFSGADGIDVENCPMCGRKVGQIDMREQIEELTRQLTELEIRLSEKEKAYKTASGLLSQCQMENGGLKERIAELETELEVKDNLLKIKNGLCSNVLFVNDDVFDSERIDKEELRQAMRNMKIEPLKEDAVVTENSPSREWLEERHQSGCIEINRLNTALEVVIEKYQRLRELKGL